MLEIPALEIFSMAHAQAPNLCIALMGIWFITAMNAAAMKTSIVLNSEPALRWKGVLTALSMESALS